MTNDKKTLITILAVVALAVLAILAGFEIGARWQQRKMILQATVPQNRFPVVAQLEIGKELEAAVNSGDMSQCDALKDPQQQTQCKNVISINIASEKKDSSLCDKALDVAACKDAVTHNLAQSANDPSYCKTLADQVTQASCIFNFWDQRAIKEHNPSLCNNLAEQLNKDLCKETVQTIQ